MTDLSGTPAIEQRVRIAAPPETVWAFWTEPDRLLEWWATDAEAVPEPGGAFRVVVQPGATMLGAFVELDPPQGGKGGRLVFTFGWVESPPAGPMAPGSTLVEVTLTPEDGETVLVLRHFGLPEAQVPDHRHGWAHFVGDRLPAAARGA